MTSFERHSNAPTFGRGGLLAAARGAFPRPVVLLAS
jgi:hypothetical protein